MNKSPAFPFYASDFLADVAGWTAEEVGVYMRLLASEWVNGCVPPFAQGGSAAGAKQAVNRLALVAGVSVAQLRRVWPQVGTKFDRGEDGNLRNPRLETERQKQVDYRIERSKAGAAGADKRWNQKHTHQETDGSANSSANGSAMNLPLANGMAKNSLSSSSSFSSSFVKPKGVYTPKEEQSDSQPMSHVEQEEVARRVWTDIKSTPEGRAVAEKFGF